MALSDYDTLSFDHKLRPTNGVFKSKYSKVSIEIYKNWLYIRDPEAWKENEHNSFVSPTVGQICSSGITYYKGIEIITHIGKRNEIYCIVTETKYHKNNKHSTYRMCGIGCYGWKTRIKEYLETKLGFKNVRESDWGYYGEGNKKGWTDFVYNQTKKSVNAAAKKKKAPKAYKVAKDFELNVWTGVDQEMINNLKNLIRKELYIDPEFKNDNYKWFHSIKWNELLRFNQGDAYITNALGYKTPITKAGESDKPILTQAINNMKTE
jgi:hypothetical protein